MSYEELFQDVKGVEAQPPIIPQDDYNAVVSSVTIDTVETQDGETREVIRAHLTFQNNPGRMLTDGVTPVDGQTAEYTIFIPNEADKSRPAKYGRGSMYDVSLRRIRYFLEACGVNPEQCADLSEALNACAGATVIVRVGTRTSQEGIIYDQIVGVRK